MKDPSLDGGLLCVCERERERERESDNGVDRDELCVWWLQLKLFLRRILRYVVLNFKFAVPTSGDKKGLGVKVKKGDVRGEGKIV